MSYFKRVFVIVLDGVGVGCLPDAHKFGDKGSNTLVNLANSTNGLSLPNLEKLGLGNIIDIKGLGKTKALGCYGKMDEKNPAKNSDAGHWEIMGYIKEPAFPLYPRGFPNELICEFEKRIGTKIIGNFAASGTEIIKELGEEHMLTRFPIVYTSADSVFQIATHVDIISIEELYRLCEVARGLCVDKYEVGRIIARPFIGEEGKFERVNERRRDYPLPFEEETVLDKVKRKNFETIAYGEVGQFFNMKGITKYEHTKNNAQAIAFITNALNKEFKGVVFGNLVEYDMVYGHRRDTIGFKKALEYFDNKLGKILTNLKRDDLLIITADHGCDPTFKGTDHTREYVPLLVYGRKCKQNINLGTRRSFADVGKTIAANFGVELGEGESFLQEIID